MLLLLLLLLLLQVYLYLDYTLQTNISCYTFPTSVFSQPTVVKHAALELPGPCRDVGTRRRPIDGQRRVGKIGLQPGYELGAEGFGLVVVIESHPKGSLLVFGWAERYELDGPPVKRLLQASRLPDGAEHQHRATLALWDHTDGPRG